MLRFMLIFDKFLINFWWFSIAPTLQKPRFSLVKLQFSHICLFAYASLAVTRFGVDFGGFEPSKRPPRGSKMPLGGLLGVSWEALEGVLDPLGRLLDSLGRLLNPLGGSKSLLGRLQEAPRASQEAPRASQEGPRASKEGPRDPQEAYKKVPRGSQGLSIRRKTYGRWNEA